MIDGLKIEFTTEELQFHLRDVASWWDRQADRAEVFISRHDTSDREGLEMARRQVGMMRDKARMWYLYSNHLPKNEVFRFTDEQCSRIQFPVVDSEALPDASFEQVLFYTTKDAIASLLGMSGGAKKVAPFGGLGGMGGN